MSTIFAAISIDIVFNSALIQLITMATRSKETLAGSIKLEIQEAFKSEDFQKLLQSAIEEALNATIPKVIEPLTKTIVDLQEKVSSLESQL